jgi:inhibitor of cysteine peptidase
MKARAGLLALVAATTLMGCTSKTEPPNAPVKAEGPQTIEISYDDLLKEKQISRSVSMSVGETLTVSLGSNISTGFTWAEKMLISDPKVMTQTGHRAVAPNTGMPGAPGTEVWILEAKAPGNTTVSTTYGRPWPGGEKDSWVFSANVTVN